MRRELLIIGSAIFAVPLVAMVVTWIVVLSLLLCGVRCDETARAIFYVLSFLAISIAAWIKVSEWL